jgi:hypothetical protein
MTDEELALDLLRWIFRNRETADQWYSFVGSWWWEVDVCLDIKPEHADLLNRLREDPHVA